MNWENIIIWIITAQGHSISFWFAPVSFYYLWYGVVHLPNFLSRNRKRRCNAWIVHNKILNFFCESLPKRGFANGIMSERGKKTALRKRKEVIFNDGTHFFPKANHTASFWLFLQKKFFAKKRLTTSANWFRRVIRKYCIIEFIAIVSFWTVHLIVVCNSIIRQKGGYCYIFIQKYSKTSKNKVLTIVKI